MQRDQANAKPTFQDYGLKAAMRFLKTAIVIDDEITAPDENGPSTDTIVEAPPFTEHVIPIGEPPKAADNSAQVAIKPLADAFLDQQIVCGVLKPTMADGEEEVISRAVKAAAVADIVIIDWYLRKLDNKLALSILKTILTSDNNMNGRLRLVIVYTSAIPLHERCSELAKHLTEAGLNATIDADDGTLLIVDACRIKFTQKKSGTEGVPVEALPTLAIGEFARHSSGLLSNFALLGIAAVRDATHHILSNLDSRLDPAFVGHRILLGEAPGAHDFAMSIFMLQMKSLLSLPMHLGGALGDSELVAWLDGRFDYAEADDQLKKLGLNKEKVKAAFANVADKPEKYHSALFLSDATKSGIEVGEIEQSVSHEFARLVTYVREFGGHNPLPPDWLPALTLGTVVKLKGQTDRYFLCTQPLCDTVRITEDRYFPFIELVEAKADKKTENLVIKDGENCLVVTVSSKAGSRQYEKFQPHVASGSVLAEAVLNKGKSKTLQGFTFKSKSDHFYWWLGDIDPFKAQRVAVELSGTLARVGIDEFEWLRRGGTAKN
ncbi:response regulator receiver domain [Agrobacterium vitis]|uniref:response regulator receiver domain n=1 Tax=Agrobacterium vitis TaxID=373 RepID=UPI00403EABDA